MIGPGWCWPKRGVCAAEREGELTVAPAVLAALPLAGRLVTGDALYGQSSLCRQIRQQGGDYGDYLVTVKANQPNLLWTVQTLFAHPPPGERFATAVRWDQHGERVERRRLWASAALVGDLDWPGARQVLCVERTGARNGQTTRQVRSAITSLGPEVAATTLLGYVRGHWAIENRLHWVRDVTLGEDASQVRSGAAPQIMAALRHTVLGLLRRAGWTNIAAARRQYAWQPAAALAVLGLSLP